MASVARYLNRELSRLDFYGRVLSCAEDTSTPLLERAKFLALFSEHVDEFFQLRVAGLKDQLHAGLGVTAPDGMSPAEQLRAIRAKVDDLLVTQSKVFLDDVVPALAEAGIVLSDWDSLDDDDRTHLVEVFEHRIFPVLTPLSVDPSHPFPYISNLSLNLAVIVSDPASGERRLARVKVPPLLPRFVVMPDGERFVPLEQVIAAHLDRLFPGMTVECHFPFRVTRNADLALEEEEADDLLAAIEIELRRRRRRAVRLEMDAATSDEVRSILVRELELHDDDVYAVRGPIDLAGLWAVVGLDRPELKDEPWAPMTPAILAAGDEEIDLFALLRERDILVHHPYDSFATSVEAFINQAADDPHVLAIKQTLYRTSGNSPIVAALVRAAEQGKQVAAVVELKARGDEHANIAWARALEDAGVHVVYGLVGLKTHGKVALVVRQEGDDIRRYFHVGTGNYNHRTARLYEDVGLLSADAELGADLGDLFNFLTGYSRQSRFRKLVLAPTHLRDRLCELIHEEAANGASGRIVLKVNSLVDPTIIDALYDASAAGVSVDLIVRGMCALRPGVEGLSDNIRVRSLVGRFLEHSRIFAFGGGAEGPEAVYISSADLMERNLDRRIEIMLPVDDVALRDRLLEALELALVDDAISWQLAADGTWTKIAAENEVSLQQRLRDAARARARRRRDPESLAEGER